MGDAVEAAQLVQGFGMIVDAQPFRRLTRGEREALEEAAARYAAFLEAPVTLNIPRG